MGKTSKNGSGSGGDERNMYVRRYKSTSNPSKASSDANLAERERETESSSRLKQSGSATTRQNTGGGRKSKVRSPVKTGLGQPANRVNKPNTISFDKETKKASGAARTKGEMTKLKQAETAHFEPAAKSFNENKELTEPVENIKQFDELNKVVDQPSNQDVANSYEDDIEVIEENGHQNGTNENGKTEQNGQNEKEEEFDLRLETDDNCLNLGEDTPKELSEISDKEVEQKIFDALVGEVQENSQTDSESCSVEIVESTTSELSEATESNAPSEIKDKDSECQNANNDSSIPLKDVQVKLSDYRKESKTEGNVDQSEPEEIKKDVTFGRTLRTISGRTSLSRMRHITHRDRQPSPNSSLFVNTSTVSADVSTDYKPTHHRSTLSELNSSNNGTPTEKKRKLLEQIVFSPRPKKTKIEESSSLLNTSIEFLKSSFTLKRPAQVSTPVKSEEEKLNISASEEVKADELPVAIPSKKWCVIM